jgi:hypothetical protein
MPTVYNYHPLTGEFIDATEARIDPLEGTPMLPGSATWEEPPTVSAGFVAVFEEEEDEWTVVEQDDVDEFDPIPSDDTAGIVRADRDRMLRLSDWTQLADAPITTEQVVAWATYRQALRDVPEQPGFPETVTWPTAPVE